MSVQRSDDGGLEQPAAAASSWCSCFGGGGSTAADGTGKKTVKSKVKEYIVSSVNPRFARLTNPCGLASVVGMLTGVFVGVVYYGMVSKCNVGSEYLGSWSQVKDLVEESGEVSCVYEFKEAITTHFSSGVKFCTAHEDKLKFEWCPDLFEEQKITRTNSAARKVTMNSQFDDLFWRRLNSDYAACLEHTNSNSYSTHRSQSEAPTWHGVYNDQTEEEAVSEMIQRCAFFSNGICSACVQPDGGFSCSPYWGPGLSMLTGQYTSYDAMTTIQCNSEADIITSSDGDTPHVDYPKMDEVDFVQKMKKFAPHYCLLQYDTYKSYAAQRLEGVPTGTMNAADKKAKAEFLDAFIDTNWDPPPVNVVYKQCPLKATTMGAALGFAALVEAAVTIVVVSIGWAVGWTTFRGQNAGLREALSEMVGEDGKILIKGAAMEMTAGEFAGGLDGAASTESRV